MRIYEQPVEGYENKFVVTEERAYFAPYFREIDAPKMIEILGQVFDLNDPDVVREVDGEIFGGRIILGYYGPSIREVIIHTPLETSDYVERRMKEVFNVRLSILETRDRKLSDEPEYISDLRILRRFIQEGSFGYKASDDVIFQRLKSRCPQAYSAFGEERWREVLERYRYSPYIEKVEALPESQYKEKWLKDLRELRRIMILFQLGYGAYAMGMIFGKLENRHPEAHEAFKKELEDQGENKQSGIR